MHGEYFSVFSPEKNTPKLLLFCLIYEDVYMNVFTFTVYIFKEIVKPSVKLIRWQKIYEYCGWEWNR
jgi:hypothetical protein